MFRIRHTVALVAALGVLTACGGGSSNPLAGGDAQQGTVVVGSANFPENVLLGEVYAQALESTGAKVQRKFNIGAREIIFGQIKSGGITVLPEYNGALLAHLDKNDPATSTDAVNAALREKLPASLEILTSSKAENKDTISVTKATAERYGLKSLEDLAPVAGRLLLGGPAEFEIRKQGVVGLKSEYGIEFRSFRTLDTGGPITVAALKKGDVQAANLFTTDPAIRDNGFVVLEDPKNVFSSQNVTPLVYKSGVTAEGRAALDKVSAALDTSTLAAMLERVVVKREDSAAVAKQWLATAGVTS
ncbi:MAG TPA: ABC transporter substrate-binding protein [Mycobacteriales bacterium]|jgi:osmoprotectant transport system substrate-binding protein|nr:ABC transporter substrate-binding protein [Mycobacteriales bacterium]